MLAELFRLKRELPSLIANPNTDWRTLNVLYEEPRVERVWAQVGDLRLYLHRIHPTPKPFFHPHPWPSAIYLKAGLQIMNVGYGLPDGAPPPVATTLHLVAGASYEMTHPHSWHSVEPLDEPSLSLMVSGIPWATTAPKPAQRAANRPLSDAVKAEILKAFSLRTF